MVVSECHGQRDAEYAERLRGMYRRESQSTLNLRIVCCRRQSKVAPSFPLCCGGDDDAKKMVASVPATLVNHIPIYVDCLNFLYLISQHNR